MVFASEALMDKPCIVSQGRGHRVIAHPISVAERGTNLAMAANGRTLPANREAPPPPVTSEPVARGSVLVEVLLRDVLSFALAVVGTTEVLNRFRLILGRSVRVTALCAEDLPKALVFSVRDPASIWVMTPAKAQPTCVWEVALLA
jgi:hypothetical protein